MVTEIMMTALCDSPKILLVEDHDLVAADIQNKLKNLGYLQVTTVTQIESVLPTLKQIKPELALINITQLSDIDRVWSIQFQYQVPIVCLIDCLDDATLAMLSAIQPFSYVLKPCNCQQLQLAIELTLVRHWQEQTTRNALVAAQTQNQSLQAQLEENLEYLAMATHELRNPLGIVRSVAEVLTSIDEQLSPQRRTRYLNRLLTATENLDDLLRSTLTYSYIRVGRLDASPTQLDWVSFCQAQVNNLTQIDRFTPSPAINFQPQAKSCIAHTNPQLLEPLVQNLIMNALAYSSQEAAIGNEVDVTLTWDTTTIVLTVEDHGIGIPKANQAEIFRPFLRGENVEAIPGVGLGLSIAQQCAQRLGGTVELLKSSPEGSCFQAKLPRDLRTVIPV